MLFNQGITIYNAYHDRDEGIDKVHMTYIDKAHWVAQSGVKLGEMTVSTEQTVTVVIPMDTEGFVLPSKLDKQAVESLKWTLKPDNVIIKGQGSPVDDLSELKVYDERMVIQSYEINDFALIDFLNNYTAKGK